MEAPDLSRAGDLVLHPKDVSIAHVGEFTQNGLGLDVDDVVLVFHGTFPLVRCCWCCVDVIDYIKLMELLARNF